MIVTPIEQRLAEIDRLAARGGILEVCELMDFLGDPEWQTRRAAASAIASAVPALADVEARDHTIGELLRAIGSAADAPRRAAAIVALEAIGRMALPHLEVALNEAPASMRTALAGVIGGAGGPGAVRLLEPLSQESDHNVAAASILALGRTRSPEALGLLLEWVEGSDEWLKFAAIGALGELGDGRAVPHVAALIDDTLLRETAIASLVEIGTADAARALGAQVMSPDGAEIRSDALTALVSVATQSRTLPSGVSDAILRVARESIPSTARDPLLEVLSELLPTGQTGKLNACLTALGWLQEPRVLPYICELLRDCSFAPTAREVLSIVAHTEGGPMALMDLTPDPLPQMEAALVLAEIRSPAALEGLLRLLNEAEDEETAATCSSALDGFAGWLIDNHHLIDHDTRERIHQLLRSASTADYTSIGPARMLGIMTERSRIDIAPEMNRELLDSGRDEAGVLASLAFLTECDAARAVAAAIKAAKHPAARVRVAAIETMARHSDESKQLSLISHLMDESPAVRRAAARNQRFLGAGIEVRRSLAASLSDEDVWVRVEAIGTLAVRSGNDPDVSVVLREELNSAHPLCRVAAIEAQRSMDTPDWNKLKDLAIHDQHAEVRTAALGMVAWHPDRSVVVSYLNRALSDPDWAVRFTAIDLSIGHGFSDIGERLAIIGTDPEEIPAVRAHAIRALSRWSHSAAVRVAVIGLEDPAMIVIEAAFNGLARLGPQRADELEAHCANCSPRAANYIDLILNGVGAESPSGFNPALPSCPPDVCEQV